MARWVMAARAVRRPAPAPAVLDRVARSTLVRCPLAPIVARDRKVIPLIGDQAVTTNRSLHKALLKPPAFMG